MALRRIGDIPVTSYCVSVCNKPDRRLAYFFAQLESTSTQRRKDASSSAETMSKRPLSETPSNWRRTIAATETRAAISPYSMAVAPETFLNNNGKRPMAERPREAPRTEPQPRLIRRSQDTLEPFFAPPVSSGVRRSRAASPRSALAALESGALCANGLPAVMAAASALCSSGI